MAACTKKEINLTQRSFISFKSNFVGGGAYIGEFPDKDPRQSCKEPKDCDNENETCHSVQRMVGGYCGPEKCQTSSECPSVGHIVYGVMSGRCHGGLCSYFCCMIAK